ncbi:MAG TPA: DMT family transporter, partial [Tabrizicola sp.]|nr:DMT family transporter [Tabrizicola sp.]
SIVGLMLVLSVGAMTGQLGRIRRDRLGGHALRNLCHFTGQSLWFWAVTMIPLAQVFALEFTSPIWVILLSPLVLGENLTRRKLIAVGLGFAGVLIVVRPDFGNVEPGVLAAAGSAIFFATTTLLTKRLTRDEPVIGILFWLTLMQIGLGFGMAQTTGGISLPTAATLPWLGLIGLAGVTAHLCLTTALTLAPASQVVPVDFARLPVIAVVGAVFYAEPLDKWLFLGAGLILAGILLSFRIATNRQQPENVMKS